MGLAWRRDDDSALVQQFRRVAREMARAHRALTFRATSRGPSDDPTNGAHPTVRRRRGGMPDYDLLMSAGPSMRRRLAAILAADIAGYSRLMGQDEAGTVRDLKGHQAVILPLVTQHGGRDYRHGRRWHPRRVPQRDRRDRVRGPDPGA